jgi:type III restriction enzyme
VIARVIALFPRDRADFYWTCFSQSEQTAFLLPCLRRAPQSNHAFPWSRKVLEANKCLFNRVPCDNDFEKAFARFLENADDIRTFAKLPQPFGFSIDYTDAGVNLRSYYPDFVAVDKNEVHWLIETKGMESAEVGHKDLAATNWCENASALTKIKWKYVKVPQKGFEVLQPARLGDLAALGAPTGFES